MDENIRFELISSGTSWDNIRLRDDLVIKIHHPSGENTVYSSVVEVCKLYHAVSEGGALRYTTGDGTELSVDSNATERSENENMVSVQEPNPEQAICLTVGSVSLLAERSVLTAVLKELLADVFRAKDLETNPENRADGIDRLQTALEDDGCCLDVEQLREEVNDPALISSGHSSELEDLVRADLQEIASRYATAGNHQKAGYWYAACSLCAFLDAEFESGIALYEGYAHLSQAVSNFVIGGNRELAEGLFVQLSPLFNELFDAPVGPVDLGLLHEYRGDIQFMLGSDLAKREYWIAKSLYETHYSKQEHKLWTEETHFKLHKSSIRDFLSDRNIEKISRGLNLDFTGRVEWKISMHDDNSSDR